MASTAGAVWHLVDEFGQKQPTSIRELQTLFDSGGVGHTSKVSALLMPYACSLSRMVMFAG